MTKIEEIIQKNCDVDVQLTDSLITSFEEYAEYYAKKCLKIASEHSIYLDETDRVADMWAVYTNPIDIKLPEHE